MKQATTPSLRHRRHTLRLLGGTLASAWFATQTRAQDQSPQRRGSILRIFVGAAPGTVMDIAARQIGEVLAQQNGYSVVVDNRPSAGGIVALEALQRATPDGETVCLVHAMQMAAAPSLFSHLPYKPLDDFAPLGILFRGPQLLTVNPSVAANSWAELVQLLKRQPGRYRYATPGNGTPQHLTMEQIKAAAGIDIQHIPYRGPAANLAALSGEVELLLEGVAPLLPHVRAGKLRALAIGGQRRVAVLPDVPTFDELGIAGIGTVWVGMVAPKATSDALVQRLNGELTHALNDPALRAAIEGSGRIVSPGSPREMTETIQRETTLWQDVVQRARITPE